MPRRRNLNINRWRPVDDEDFSAAEFTVVDNEVTVRGTVNGVPIDELVFYVSDVDDFDWSDPINSLREYIRNVLVDMLAELEDASSIPGTSEVRVFIESGQLSGYLPADDLSSRMRERVRERMKGK